MDLSLAGANREDLYNQFRHRLKKARESAGLTQQQAAERLNKPQSYVSKCETGERRVDFLELLEFCKVYGVSLSHFIPGEDTNG